MIEVLKSITEVETAMNELQLLESQVAEEEASANAKIAKIRNGLTASTGAIEEQIIKLRNTLVTFADQNRDNTSIFPSGRKTLEVRAGYISIRAGTESVTLRSGFDSDEVVERARELGIKGILRKPPEELDKTAVKKLYQQEKIDDAQLKKLGLQITSKEEIKIELKTVDKYDKLKA